MRAFWVWLLSVLLLLQTGCQVTGKRIFGVSVTNTGITISDEAVSADGDAPGEYSVTFDPAGLNIIQWIIDAFKKPPEEPAADAAADKPSASDGIGFLWLPERKHAGEHTYGRRDFAMRADSGAGTSDRLRLCRIASPVRQC